jgi:hypothetical protein
VIFTVDEWVIESGALTVARPVQVAAAGLVLTDTIFITEYKVVIVGNV